MLQHLAAGAPLISVICYCPNEFTGLSRALDPLRSQGLNYRVLFKTALTRTQESREVWLRMMNSQWKCLSDTSDYLDIPNLHLQGDKTIVNTSKKLNLFCIFSLLSADFYCQNIPVSQSWIVLAHCHPKHLRQWPFFLSSSRIVQLTNVKISTSFKATMLLHQNMTLHQTKSNVNMSKVSNGLSPTSTRNK